MDTLVKENFYLKSHGTKHLGNLGHYVKNKSNNNGMQEGEENIFNKIIEEIFSSKDKDAYSRY